MVKISIIIPAYNAEKHIGQCLECCLNQTYTDFEIVVVNDGSIDETQHIIEKFQLLDNRIILINQNNQGLVKARVSGINIASGEYVFFIDADDTMPYDALEKLYYNSENDDIIIGDFLLLDSNHNKLARQYKNNPVYGTNNFSMLCNYLTKSVTASLCGRLIKRTLLMENFVPTDITIGEDFIYNLLILGNTDISIKVLNEPVYNYIQYPTSMINSKNQNTLNQRLKYIKWVVDYVHNKNISNNVSLPKNLSLFVFNEYYSYLRDGGKPSDNIEFYRDYVLANWNKKALDTLPKWQYLMIQLFKKSEKLGLIYKTLFVNVRHFIS